MSRHLNLTDVVLRIIYIIIFLRIMVLWYSVSTSFSKTHKFQCSERIFMGDHLARTNVRDPRSWLHPVEPLQDFVFIFNKSCSMPSVVKFYLLQFAVYLGQ